MKNNRLKMLIFQIRIIYLKNKMRYLFLKARFLLRMFKIYKKQDFLKVKRYQINITRLKLLENKWIWMLDKVQVHQNSKILKIKIMKYHLQGIPK